MTSDALALPQRTRPKGSVKRAEPANAVLHALLKSGYRTEDQRDTVGEGILLHPPGDGPDLVLYADGSLQPVGMYRRQPDLPATPHIAPLRPRGLKANFIMLAKGLGLLIIATGFWFLSMGLWLAILENF